MTDTLNAYCSACDAYHAAEVLERDEHGWPSVTRFLEPCSTIALREGLGKEAGAALGMAVDIGDFELAEKAADVALRVNDPREEEPS